MAALTILGIMSGTSLDGLDLAWCSFLETQGRWSYAIQKATCIPYSEQWRSRLKNATELSGLELSLLDLELGQYIGKNISEIQEESGLKADYIASHGHTVFHQPEKKLTLQIGSGQAIATLSGVPTINQFRTKDVLLGGQGAPLVPIGDKLLFADKDYCLNIGGIANVSFEQEGKRLAYDICPANMVLNALANKEGLEYDKGGELARAGRLLPEFFDRLNGLSYYQQAYPKSLGKEWVDEQVFPLLEAAEVKDALRTFTEHAAYRIVQEIAPNKRVLLTGGGAYNSFLVERMKQLGPRIIWEIPDSETIAFKEALIFAFLGFLYLQKQPNCLASVTGASCDSSGGVLQLP